jgi:DNA-binding response OmpR family regulator
VTAQGSVPIPRVLVVEDDPALRRLLHLLLSTDGFVVSAAEDGIDGLAACDSGTFDVIVCDVMMPRLSGLGLCRELRETRKSTIPVILLTARTFDEDVEMVMRLGGITFMNKPFDHDQLVRSIMAAMTPPDTESVPGSDRLGWLRSTRSGSSPLGTDHSRR